MTVSEPIRDEPVKEPPLFATGWLCLGCGHKTPHSSGFPCPACSGGPLIRAVIERAGE